jgi:homoserine kinase type II
MGGFTRLTDKSIGQLADAFGIGSVSAWKEIEAGTINSNFAIHAEGGRYFLRINEGKSEEAVRYEAELVAALAERGVPTPVPVESASGQSLVAFEGKWVSLFPWVVGGHRKLGEVSASDAREVGIALASLHQAGLPLADSMPRAGIYTFDDIVGRYREFADSEDPELALAISEIATEIAWLRTHATEREQAPVGIIHGDLFRDNVMFDGPRLSALIDFEQASTGSLVYDLAVCLNAWCFTDHIELDVATALVDGYQSVRVLEESECAALPIETRAAAMRFAVTRVTDVYLPGISAPGKDFRRYVARLQAWRQLDAGDYAALITSR